MKGPLAIIVTGDRNWDNAQLLDRVLDELDPELVIEGTAKGADTLAGFWTTRHDRILYERPAQWLIYKNGAGPIRNADMLRSLTKLGRRDGYNILVVAFHDSIEESSGTADMLCQAEDAGVDYVLVGKTK